MITLENKHLLGTGNERHCFIHPKDEKLCIKINKPESYINDTPEQSLVEHDYYRYLETKLIPLTHLPECHGWVETNLGRGLVFDRIRSSSTGSSLSLKKAIDEGHISRETAKVLINELKDYLFQYRLLLSDLNDQNLSIQLEPTPKIYLIDGIGSRNMDIKYKIRKRLPFLAHHKTKKQWSQYHHKIEI